MYGRMNVCAYICTCTYGMHVCTSARMYAYVRMYICMYACMYACMYVAGVCKHQTTTCLSPLAHSSIKHSPFRFLGLVVFQGQSHVPGLLLRNLD